MFYLVFLGLNCKLWNLVFRPIYGPCAKRTGHKTRSVKKKIVVLISYSTGRLTPLNFKAFVSDSHCHWFQNNRRWICFSIHQWWRRGRHLHEQRLGDWTRRSNKQNPNMPATQIRCAFDLFGYEAMEKYSNLQDEREEKDHLFFKHFKMTLQNEEVRMCPTD